MEDYCVEYYIDNGVQITELSSMNEEETEQWKKDMEERALSEYYNRKIKIKI